MLDMDTDLSFHRPLIQIAGVHDLAEAGTILAAGADLVGIPLRLPVHKEDLDEDAARDISRALPGRCCLITYLSEPAEILVLARFLEIDWIQLHGHIPVESLRRLRERMSRVRLLKSLIIGKEAEPALHERLREYTPWVSAFITDTWDPASGAEGATGKKHDWSISRRLCETATKPVILAGGLHAGNVAQAVRTTRCHGVDAHTGVEGPDGRKCQRLLKEFLNGARTAFEVQKPG